MILYLTLLMENNPMNNKYRQLTLFIIGHYNCNYKINDKKIKIQIYRDDSN